MCVAVFLIVKAYDCIILPLKTKKAPLFYLSVILFKIMFLIPKLHIIEEMLLQSKAMRTMLRRHDTITVNVHLHYIKSMGRHKGIHIPLCLHITVDVG